VAELALTGTEVWTVELSGSVPRSAVESAASGFELVEMADGVEVGLLAFGMRGLRLDAMPLMGFDYAEALWRIGIRVNDKPAWLAHTCDLDRPMVRAFGRRFIRYPARAAQIEGQWDEQDWRLQVRATEALSARLQASGCTPEPTPPRPVFVRDAGRSFTVPWAEDPAPYRQSATLTEIEDDLAAATLGGPVQWTKSALVHRGRTHHCGFARRIW
jgi:hypothetical protein